MNLNLTNKTNIFLNFAFLYLNNIYFPNFITLNNPISYINNIKLPSKYLFHNIKLLKTNLTALEEQTETTAAAAAATDAPSLYGFN